MLVALLAARAETARAYRGDMIRLHVLASGDDEAAQALKLKVRDACLDEARALLADCGSADAAWAAVNGHLSELAAAAGAEALRQGYDGAVTAETGVYDFPARRYGDSFVPAGRYRALRVVIGPGEGRNWWCVLYPSLCMPEEYRDGQPVRFYSALWEWLTSLFGGDGA